MSDIWLIIGGLAIGTFTIRSSGYLLGSRLPASGIWARTLAALPGCLIAALLASMIVQGGQAEWLGALIASTTAIITRSLPLTMLAGMGAVAYLRFLL